MPTKTNELKWDSDLWQEEEFWMNGNCEALFYTSPVAVNEKARTSNEMYV